MKLLPAMAAAVLFSGFCATLLAYQGLIFEDDDELSPLVEPRPEINVMLNWFEELKQKVPSGRK
jgi:hypothetical protein